MNAVAAEHSKFDPPPQRDLVGALGLALIVHLLLILALTWGLRWKNQPQVLAVEAELWSPVVQQAAPRPVEQVPTPVPPPPAPPPPPPQPTVTQDHDAEIALAQKKKRDEAERKLVEERKKQEQAKKQAEAQAAKEKAEEDARRAEEAAEKKAAAEARRKEEAEKKAAAEAKRKEEADKKAEKDAETARRTAALRDMSKWAGTTDNGGGSAARAAGPSGDYAGRIRAAVRPNIVFTDNVPGNPVAEVEVAVDEKTGMITSRRITKSSGIKSWDDAVLRALDRTEKLPADHGLYWNPMLMTFRLYD
jgi:colicin import membrane protein